MRLGDKNAEVSILIRNKKKDDLGMGSGQKNLSGMNVPGMQRSGSYDGGNAGRFGNQSKPSALSY